MGTATMSYTESPMEKQKKPNLIKLITTLFQKKNKKFEQNEKNNEKVNQHDNVKKEKKSNTTLKVTPVATLLKEFEQISIKDKTDDKNDELNNFSYTRDRKDSTEDKDSNEFERAETRSDRFGSHSSQDSGYSELGKNDIKEEKEIKEEENEIEEDDDVIKKLEDLKIGKKKLHTVYLPRAPIKNKGEFVPASHPYAREIEKYREVVNTNSFSGGQVFVKPQTDHLTEISRALSTIETNVQNFPQNDDQQNFLLETGFEFVAQETGPQAPEYTELPEDIHVYIEEMTGSVFPEQTYKDTYNISNTFLNFDLDANYPVTNKIEPTHTFPTPPYSENALSPLSLNLGSPPLELSSEYSLSNTSEYSLSPGRPLTNSEYSLSPGRSPINHDLERYQEIPEGNLDLPNFYEMEKPTLEKKKSNPTSLMSMKQYKDLQKELSAEFSKFDCCLLSRESCKEIFEGHAKKLKLEERKTLCVKLARLDTKTAYEVLQHVLLSLSAESKQEDLQCALFSLLCERVLAQRPDLFLGDFGQRRSSDAFSCIASGFGLLKSAALRCHRRPLFTRYIVQCVRTALRLDPSYMEGRDSVFHETDALGDTLVTACARAGDAFADVLHELVCNSPPLFRLQHANTEGYTALHVACKLHSTDKSYLRIVHVLLEHGHADLWIGDVKGGDTALHLAVNSSTCELRLVMVLFRHVERAKWKQLAHVANRSSVTPIEYARSQSKSISRPYPPEVLDFLKKCR